MARTTSRCVMHLLFSMCTGKVTGRIECTKLHGVDYLLPRNFEIKIIYVLPGSLLYSLNRNALSTAIHSAGCDSTLKP